MKIVELFCGTGGFSRGAHAAGFDVAVAYDKDAVLTSSYKANFPNTVIRTEDITYLTGETVLRDAGDDVLGIIGGPPCQGFSDIGKRDPGDPRRDLLGHFFRIVNEVRPAFFVMENVRGLSYPENRPVLDAAIALLGNGYDITTPTIWNAKDFGAATSRNRMFVIGVRADLEMPLSVADVEKRKRKPATVRQAIADLAEAFVLDFGEAGTTFDNWRIAGSGRVSDYAKRLRAPDRTFSGNMRTVHTTKVVRRYATVPQGGMDRVGRHPRLAWGGQCPTLRAGTGSDLGSFQSVRPLHPEENRVITVREAARLQGFPDDHFFHPTIWHSFRMIGNSVSPIMGEAVLSAIAERLGLSTGSDAPPELMPMPEELPIAAE